MISQLPPPVHGSTVMTRRLMDTITTLGGSVHIVDRRFSRSVQDIGRASAGKLLAIPALALRLTAALIRRRPDVVVLFLTNRPGSFLVDVLMTGILRAFRTPVVLYVHTVGFEALATRGVLWTRLVRFALGSGTVVTLGPALMADVTRFVRTPPVAIANPTEDAPVAHATSEPNAAFHVVYLSNLLPEKGADAFLRAATTLAGSAGAWRFTLAGAGSDARVAELQKASAQSPADIAVVGAVDDAGKWALLADADVLLFPSTYPYEAQPLTIVEAMASGVPVVAYDVGGIRDLIAHGTTGMLVPTGDETALAAAVRGIADDPRRAASMRAAAMARHAEAHSMRRYGAAWNDLLHLEDEEPVIDGFAATPAAFRALVTADWRANPRDVKSRVVLLGFRLAQLAMRDPLHPRLLGMLVVAAYRAWTEFSIGLELRPKTRVGGGLTIYHGYALVVNDHAVIGRRVVLRNGITIGQRIPGGPTPVIGDDVEIGAGAIVLGDITIGDGARIGAGAVVLIDVPAGAAAVGNPARVLPSAS